MGPNQTVTPEPAPVDRLNAWIAAGNLTRSVIGTAWLYPSVPSGKRVPAGVAALDHEVDLVVAVGSVFGRPHLGRAGPAGQPVGAYVGQVGHPQLVRAGRDELPLDQVLGPRCLRAVPDGGPAGLLPRDPT